jgi:hypothetical protein
MKLPRRVSPRSDVDHAPSRPRGDVGPAPHTRRDYEEGAEFKSLADGNNYGTPRGQFADLSVSLATSN